MDRTRTEHQTQIYFALAPPLVYLERLRCLWELRKSIKISMVPPPPLLPAMWNLLSLVETDLRYCSNLLAVTVEPLYSKAHQITKSV